MSKPTASMWPLCSPPRRLPAPRISRSSAATRKPLPEIAELADRGQPLLRDRRQRVLRRNQQVGVRAAIGAPDAAAQLVELRQAEAVGAVDDDRVGVRDVEAVLDDRRREQDVVLVRDEVDHHPLELVLVHLPVADGDARLGHEPRDAGRRASRSTRRGCGRSRPGRRAPSRAGSRARSPPASNLTTLVWIDRRSLRRRLDDRHVADAGERHVQRARNRRRRHRQDVDAACASA